MKLTTPQIRSLYEAGRKSYITGYASTVDDVIAGMTPVAKRLGIRVFCDVDWFRFMLSGIRNYRTWEHLSEESRDRIISLTKEAHR